MVTEKEISTSGHPSLTLRERPALLGRYIVFQDKVGIVSVQLTDVY